MVETLKPKPDETLLIAVDGGGSGCRVAVGTPATGIIAQAQGGPANVATDFNGAVRNILSSLSDALSQAGLGAAPVGDAQAHLGLAGVNSPSDGLKVSEALPFGRCTVTGDRATAVAGALGTQDGYVVALGTGTIVAGQHGGVVRTVGGWGFMLSDEASGAWLGRELLRYVLLAEDGLEPHCALSQATLRKFTERDAIVDFSIHARPNQYASYAPDVLDAAQTGDPLALDLINRGVAYLTRALAALGFEPGDTLCLAGGVGPHYATYLPAPLTSDLQPPRGSALDGAFTLALKAATDRSVL